METKVLAFTLAIGISVMLATSTSVASVLAQNATAPGNATIAAVKNATAGAAGEVKNATAGAAGEVKNATAGAAGEVKNATSNATSASSNPLAKIGKELSKIFGGK
jgi:hypothetical protein